MINYVQLLYSLYVWVQCLDIFVCTTNIPFAYAAPIFYTFRFSHLWATLWVLEIKPRSCARPTPVSQYYNISLSPTQMCISLGNQIVFKTFLWHCTLHGYLIVWIHIGIQCLWIGFSLIRAMSDSLNSSKLNEPTTTTLKKINKLATFNTS